MPATIRADPANSRRNARQPAEAGASIGPGTRKHSRPCSSAQEAVIRAPLRAGASITTVASARPLMTRLRRGKVPRVGLDVRGELRDDRPTRRNDRIGESLVDPREELGVPGPDDRNGRAPGVDRCRVGRPVDPRRQAGHDRGPGRHERGRQPGREGAAAVGCSSRSDQRNRRPRLEGARIAQHEEDGRRHLDHGEPSRVGRVVGRHDLQAQRRECARPVAAARCAASTIARGDGWVQQATRPALDLIARTAWPRAA